MTSKTKNSLKWVPSVLVAFFMTTGAIMKLAHAPQLADQYAQIGLENSMALFGIAELLFISSFLYPRTLKIGLLLLTGYFGGAMGVELSSGGFFILPAAILTVIWLAAYLREPALFKTAFRKPGYVL